MSSRLPNRHSADALPPGSSAGIEGSDGDNNAKVTHSTRLSKFRDKFYRQNIDNRRPGDAAPGKEGLLPARRVTESAFRRHETGKTAPQHPEFRRSRSSGGPQRDIPEPRGTVTAGHRGHRAREPRGSRGLGAQGARSTGGHSEDAPSPHAPRRQRAFASQ